MDWKASRLVETSYVGVESGAACWSQLAGRSDESALSSIQYSSPLTYLHLHVLTEGRQESEYSWDFNPVTDTSGKDRLRKMGFNL